MPLGSSSAAPVIKPGPSFSRIDSESGVAVGRVIAALVRLMDIEWFALLGSYVPPDRIQRRRRRILIHGCPVLPWDHGAPRVKAARLGTNRRPAEIFVRQLRRPVGRAPNRERYVRACTDISGGMAQRNPRRSVITRLLASAVLGIHTRRSHYRLQRRTEQQEIEPH